VRFKGWKLGRALAAGLLVAATASPLAAASGWEATLERVARGVVALRVSATRPFDTETASVSVATGFVVDAELGLILTNRHVVHPGPVTADAVFLNHEKIPVVPVYRDPVHDFGFFRFDPKDVRFMEFEALELAPGAARVGEEIRVLGNDAGEKLSILGGTLARLDREAPIYGQGRYNDFNTFYYQAASSSSGGSSGSPVVNRRGQVVGLNAGGKRQAASSFFLPLARVARALERIQRGEPVTRGTLQAVFSYQPYDELGRLGLRSETERAQRQASPSAIGLLVVAEVVPGGPAHRILEPGDVVLRVEGRPIAGFAELEAILDDAVGADVTFHVERGGQPLDLVLRVDDLHRITPASYVEMGGGILHDLSYQQARSFGVPVGGVYLASEGYAFRRALIPPRVVITALDGEPVRTAAEFEERMAARPDGAEVPVRFFNLRTPNSPSVAILRVERRWFPMQRCVRDDAAGLFECQASADPPASEPPAPATTRFAEFGPKAARRVIPSLALVEFDIPIAIQGVQGSRFTGAGLVVDAEAGLIVVDRDTVPITMGDVRITFGASIEVPGKVVALHPEHNLAAVSYDPALLGDTPVKTAELRSTKLEAGDDVWLVVLTARHELLARESQVSRVDAASLPIPATPRFREANVELVALTETIQGVGGVLTDAKGRVLSLWSSFSADARGKPASFFGGLAADLVADFVAPLRNGAAPVWRSLAVELETVNLAQARARGLTEELALRLEEHDPARRRVLSVRRLAAGSPAAEYLQVGDLLLGAGGTTVTTFREVERAASAERVSLEVLRNGQLLELEVPTAVVSGVGTERVVAWSGALLQPPPRELALQRGILPEGVYVAGRWRGSPAERHRLRPTLRIDAVDGFPTPDLDAFLAAVAGKQGRDSVRLRTIDLEGKARVLTLELDPVYWPTFELSREAEGWTRRRVDQSGAMPADGDSAG